MGGNIQITERGHRHGEPVGDLKITYSRLHGVNVKGQLVVRMIDEFPAFAVAAAFASGSTTIKDAEELRYKESDRISALCQGLGSLGVAVREFTDGFELLGEGVPDGGSVQSFGDHRLAMSFALAGLASGHPVTVQDAEVIKESFPSYVETFQALGANIRLEN
jgi:3-phosphoshikimate 1-carboxyvinyltransferase